MQSWMINWSIWGAVQRLLVLVLSKYSAKTCGTLYFACQSNNKGTEHLLLFLRALLNWDTPITRCLILLHRALEFTESDGHFPSNTACNRSSWLHIHNTLYKRTTSRNAKQVTIQKIRRRTQLPLASGNWTKRKCQKGFITLTKRNGKFLHHHITIQNKHTSHYNYTRAKRGRMPP